MNEKQIVLCQMCDMSQEMADQKFEMMFFVWFSDVLVNLEVKDRRKSLDKFVPRHRGRSKIRNAKVYDFDPPIPPRNAP